MVTCSHFRRAFGSRGVGVASTERRSRKQRRAGRNCGARAATGESIIAPLNARFLGALAVSGAVSGTLLDGIHSRVQLQVYDVLPVHAAGLETSAVVPPLLAVFYLSLGALTVAADLATRDDPRTAAAQRRASPPLIALNTGVLALLLHTSAVLYRTGLPFSTVSAVLATLTVANWLLFDRTPQGAALAALCAVGAPAAEVVMNSQLHLWHYPRADVAGVMVSWVPWCYAFYTPALCNYARLLWARSERQGAQKEG